MCGRFTHLYTWRQLHRLLNLTTPPIEWPPRYNVAPSQVAPIVRDLDDDQREVALLRWGLVPPWADDLKFGFRTINARAETVATAPAFRSAFQRRRCIVPVSGYYEWKKITEKSKQPFYFTGTDGEPLMLAGLWESWRGKTDDAPAVETFTVITTTPNEAAAKVHDRMPVILDRESVDRWLDPHVPGPDVLSLLRPSPPELLMPVPVSTLVNSPKNDVPNCIQPSAITGPAPSSKFGSLFD
ncbi:MAG: SOS response-associated peptidase [Phycisphaeraceae bacterium]|nr:SOS response-associated peptidase [Phycisphaerae bacterium]MBX3391100.1 SOS response-associated peptidase [Phycisphaeraceae bacterium]